MKKFLAALSALALLTGCALGTSACAAGEEYAVTCQASQNGRVIVEDNSARRGEKVILAAKPDAGYKFTGFVVDGEYIDGCSFVMPAKDVTVWAEFELLTYTVTYVLGGAAVDGNNPATYTVNSNDVELIQPQIDGYEVCGWYTHFVQDEYGSVDPEDYKVTNLKDYAGNLTLYAKYYNLPHCISFDCTGGYNCWVDIEEYIYEAFYGDVINLTVHTDFGYELVEFSYNGIPISVDNPSFTMPMSDVEVVAVFSPIEFNITYNLDGGENSDQNPATYTIEDGYFYLSPAYKEDYEFEGWYTNADFTGEQVYGIDANEQEDLTLYAKFVPYEIYD